MENLPPSELLKLAASGDQEAIMKVVDMQREGKCLRYYPQGRRSADDDGRLLAMRFKVGVFKRDGRRQVALVMESGREINVFPLPIKNALDLANIAIDRFKELTFPRLLNHELPIELRCDGESLFWQFPTATHQGAFVMSGSLLLTVIADSLLLVEVDSSVAKPDRDRANDLLEEIAIGQERDGTF
jgi:hypothetical protein